MPGQLFGEVAPMDGGPRTATVVTAAPSRVAVLDRRKTQELLRRPDVRLQVAARLARWLRVAQRSAPCTGQWTTLTETERSVAHLATKGFTNRQIGVRLCVSPSTVDAHLRHIYTKLGISSRVELAGRAALAGVVVG
jgi:DNA-binding NarL/FixJ family response regulator